MNRVSHSKQKGIVLLLAVIISSMILALGLGVFSLLFNEIGFAASARESLKSFNAADSGIECALYWDFLKGGKKSHFLDPANSYPTDGLPDFTTVECGDSVTLLSVTPLGGFGTTTSFQVSYSNQTCAIVSYERKEDPVLSGRIVSDGRNVSCGSPAADKVERSIEVTFP